MLSNGTIQDGKCVYTLLSNASMLVDDYHCQTLGIIVFTISTIKYTETFHRRNCFM